MIEQSEKPKMIVILGPTAAGKTSWSLQLAKDVGGEIICADSRQIYKKMDIGTAKVPGAWKRKGLKKQYIVNDIPHHLIDFLDPGKVFTVAEFRDQALKHARAIIKRGNVPIVAGGTGLYISALVDNFTIPRIQANKKLRKSFDEKSNAELHEWLANLDPVSAKRIPMQNKRRLIRALEVSIMTGEPFSGQQKKGDSIFNILEIGVEVPRAVLYDRIGERIDQMMAEGLLDEVEKLRKQKYSWELSSMSGVGYRQFRDYFEHNIPLEIVVENLKRDTRHYAKRQMTWFRRDDRIEWFSNYEDAFERIARFLYN